MALQLDVEAITEDLLQSLQSRQGYLLVSFAQRRIDRPIGTTRQYDQALTMLLEPPDLEVGRLVVGGVEERPRGKLHEVAPTQLVGGEERERPGRLRARLIDAAALR